MIEAKEEADITEESEAKEEADVTEATEVKGSR